MTLFSVNNHHHNSCGIHDVVNGDDGNYHSYFENSHGEQWLFIGNRQTNDMFVYGGDLVWHNEYLVSTKGSNINLSEDETLWLFSCYIAFTRNRNVKKVGLIKR